MGDHDDLVTDGLDLGKDVRAEDHRVGPSQLTDQVADLNDLERIQPHRGLIQDNDLRVSQQRLGNTHPLPVALGQSGDPAAPHLLYSSLLHDLLYLVLQLQTMQPFGLPHETQVLLRGFVHIQRRLLRKIANEPFGLIRLLKNVVSSDSHMTLRR